MGVPAPDNHTGYPDKFDFTRLGLRIPVFLVSPWVARGTVRYDNMRDCRPLLRSLRCLRCGICLWH
jgi:hypothetical protein